MIPNPKCNCCDCLPYFDAVTGGPTANQTTLDDAITAGELSVQSGTWSIVSNRLRVTGPGAILINVPQPDGVAQMRLQVASYSSTGATITGGDPNLLRLSVDYIDDNNRHYAEAGFDPVFTTIGKIAKVSGGVETVLDNNGNNLYRENFSTQEYLEAVMCCQNETVHFSQGLIATPNDNDYTLPNLPHFIPDSTSLVGGLYAVIEVEQGATDVWEFERITLTKIGSPSCPEPVCPTCFAAVNCDKIPNNGFLVDIAGLADGTGCNTLTAFEGSFTIDERAPWYYGGLTPEPGGCGSGYAWRSAVFALSPNVNCTIYNIPPAFDAFTYGRIILVPRNNDYCDPFRFDLVLQASYVNNDTCSSWRRVGVITPTAGTGDDVAGDCTAFSGATFTGSASTDRIDTTGATITIDSL